MLNKISLVILLPKQLTCLLCHVTLGARWVSLDFSACSADCGGGVQVRKVRCVQSLHEQGRRRKVELPSFHCPVPVPSEIRPCNSHPCTGYWVQEPWSECSLTCGTGTQTRQVKCERRQSATSPKEPQPATECPGRQPDTSRKCHVTDCPHAELEHRIVEENYTLYQLRRAGVLKVNVGGQVYLLPGQSVLIKCPVRRFSKHLVYWSKGYRLLPYMGRVRNTDAGLEIQNATYTLDAGVYTCQAGDKTATVTVNFIEPNGPESKQYKTWIKDTKRLYQEDHNKLPVKPGELTKTNPQEPTNHQGDQFLNSSRNSVVYLLQDWAPCEADCGFTGRQSRKVRCSQVTSKYVKLLPDTECQQAGLTRPSVTQSCTGEGQCVGWRTGPWSQCRPSCGVASSMNRILTCEWTSTGSPANTCSYKTRPADSKPCRTKPCPTECTDKSKYCGLAKQLKMCKYYNFRQACCRTCHSDETPSAG